MLIQAQIQQVLDILHNEVKPATGCTEPISLAYAAAVAYQAVKGEDILKIEAKVSANLMKNGLGVFVPGTGVAGLPIAAAVGALGGDPEAGLQVLKNITPTVVAQGKALLAAGKVTIEVTPVPHILYSEAIIHTPNHVSRVCIADAHTNIIRRELDGQIIEEKEASHELVIDDNKKFMQTLSTKDIFEFVTTVPINDIEFLNEGADLNDLLAEEGLTGQYGLNIGACMKRSMEDGFTSNDITNTIVMYTAAASDARMGGAPLPAMTNSGSGNQGITATEPISVLARLKGYSAEKRTRALALSHLIAIYVHAFLPKLSALCAVATAAMGASAGMAYLLTEDEAVIDRALNNMTGDLIGMICDGAASSCASKVATATNSAVKAVLLARDGIRITGVEGIVAESADESIRNIGRLASVGMKETDPEILNIMLSKTQRI